MWGIPYNTGEMTYNNIKITKKMEKRKILYGIEAIRGEGCMPYFSGEMQTIKEVELTENSAKYYKEYDIAGFADIYRAKVPHNIAKGDIFNIYLGQSTKEGCVWEGDLKSSLLNHINPNLPHSNKLIQLP